ncbi:unnamed protein product [Ectocarpus sp. CCAP 1310/34]|nr:unnamed protein product [Ectocarpus sp. CCAP 1310/34]
MRETAKQQGVRLVGEMQPCVGCVEAKGRRAPVPRHGTRSAVPFGKVHIDLTDPLSDALDGSRYLIMFVDIASRWQRGYLIMFVGSASRWQRGYGMRAKSDTLNFVQRFLADMNGMGTPGCFRMDNGGEFTGSAFTSFCDAAGIRREYTAPDTPKQNAVVESAIWSAMKGGHAARRHILAMGHVDLSSIPNVGVNGHRLWLASALWASACFNRSAPKANLGWMSPFEAFFGRKPPLTVVPFFQEGMMRVKRVTKADVQSARCFYLHGANNHSTSTAVVLRADTGRLALTNNVVWVNRRAGAPAPVPGIGGGSSVTAAPSPATAPDPSLGGRGSGGAVGAGGPVDSGGGWRPQMFATMFATREVVDAALRAERPPDKMPDLPHCLASDLRVPKTLKEAMRSQHPELWDAAVGRDFFGLLDVGTFSPV